MKVGIVQPVIGSIGGNDMVLDSMLESLIDHQVTLFTFSKPNKEFPNIKVKVKIPKNIPMFGIYQKFFMPQFNYSDCDVIISATGYNVKTKKPLIIYDQNNLANDFNRKIPLKYQKGLWKLYYLPYKFLNKSRINSHAHYVANSEYSARNISKLDGISSVDVIYPVVKLDKFYSLPKKPQVCVIARISPEKNLEEVIRILNHVRFPCIIFGNVTLSNERYFQKLKKMAKSNVKILRDFPRDKLRYILAESKIIFSASFETFGISTIEGIASGCIPVVPNNSAHPEVVPIHGLRYDTEAEAVHTIESAMMGSFSGTGLLKAHINKYSFATFKTNFLNTIETVMKQ